jgi:hypothetical protein
VAKPETLYFRHVRISHARTALADCSNGLDQRKDCTVKFPRLLLSALVMLLIPAWVAAHGTGQHVLGTVTVIDATHMEVKTPKGDSVSVQLTDKTKYISKIMRRPKGPPLVGDRVVAEVETSSAGWVANEVHFSKPETKAKP